MGNTIFIILLTILYVVEVIFHEKDKKKLKDYKNKYGNLEKDVDYE